MLLKAEDVRLRLDTRKPAAQPGDARANQDGEQPPLHPRVEAVLEQVERQRTRRNEENENPERPVIEPVVELVAVADFAL